MTDAFASLALLFGQLSLLSIGGGPTVLPEMQREVVEVQGWMSAADFAALFALAQAAPGPNMLIATLVGLRVAGIPGAILATLAIITPSSLLTAATVSLWDRFRAARWRRLIQAGLVPVTVGLFLAAALIIAQGADRTPALTLITLAVTVASLATKIHPLLLLAGGGALGVLGAG